MRPVTLVTLALALVPGCDGSAMRSDRGTSTSTAGSSDSLRHPASLPVVNEESPQMSVDPRGQAIANQITPAWETIVTPSHAPGARIHWYPALSAPMPASWPPRGDGLIVWAYARGIDEQMSDGERVASPWARLTIARPGAAPTLDLLPEKIKDLGIQGVRPLPAGAPRMLPLSQAEQALFEAVSKAPVGLPSEEIKVAWCAWIEHNGVIAAAVRSSHQAFFAWIGCPPGDLRVPRG